MFRQTLNQNGFFYANYDGAEPTISPETGLPNGEVSRSFSSPVFAWGNISAATGRSTTDTFGLDVDYDVSIVLSHDLPLAEGSRLWIRKVPPESHDYEVVRISRSLNETVVAAKRLPDGDISYANGSYNWGDVAEQDVGEIAEQAWGQLDGNKRYTVPPVPYDRGRE